MKTWLFPLSGGLKKTFFAASLNQIIAGIEMDGGEWTCKVRSAARGTETGFPASQPAARPGSSSYS